MDPPAQISFSRNCLIHLHSAAGKAWLDRRACGLRQYVGRDGIPLFLVNTGDNERKLLSAHEIRTLHFRNIIATFERLYGFSIQNFVAMVPATNNPCQYLSEISAAANAAGACILFSIKRSVVAASYFSSVTPGRRTILVFELGGHFLEISLLTEDQGLNIRADVFDLGCPLFHYVASVLQLRLGNGITSDANTLLQIRTECERAKDALCRGSGSVDVKFNLVGRETIITIYREWLEKMNLNHLRSGIMRCLMEAGVQCDAVDEVVLAGASTNKPAVRQVLLEFFQRQPIRCTIDPANLIDVSFKQHLENLSNILNITVVGFQGYNLGVYAL